MIDEDEKAIKMVMLFVSRFPVLLEEMNVLYEKENWSQFSERVHNLKGTGGNFGFSEVTETAQRIESLLLQLAYDEIKAELDLLENMRRRIEQGIR